MALQDWMEEDRWRARAGSFGAAADLYDRVRPTYPVGAVEWALEPLGAGRHRVADVGAGTGIMTRVLLGLGCDVIAVEPDDLMRERLMASTPGVDAVSGSAENLPFPDGDVDAVVAAQAYHWFDRDRAHAELARVIRPGGVLSAIWNERDESHDWVAAYSAIVEGDRGADETPADGGHGPDFGAEFTPVEPRLFHHAVPVTPDSLVELLCSRSYYLTATPQRRAELEAAVLELARSHPDLAGRAEFPAPYVTRVFRAVRR